ncbi:MAG: peptide chain release factor N(5)-glutamine methyltransferase [Terrimicrobiaceae bacterium]
MTVLEVLNAATGYLKQQGVESPRLNAEHLLAHVLGVKNRINLYMEFDRPLGEPERAPLRDFVRKRSEGIPLQHLLGTVEFFGRTFRCDARALIPRPETEQLVEKVLAEAGDPAVRVVDVGTGSGVIALTLALERPEASVTAVDVSREALALAGENAALHGLSERVDFLESDLLAGVTGPFDVIVANLPYIATGEMAGLSPEVRRDPVLALDGGDDGLALVSRLIESAPVFLSAGGVLALEIGHDQAGRVEFLLTANNYRDIKKLRDYQGIERILIARHG